MTTIKKIIKKIGNSIGITFNVEEQKVYGLKEKGVVEVNVEKKPK